MPTLAETLLLQHIQKTDWKPGVTKHQQTHVAFLRAARFGVRPRRALELIVPHLRQVGAVINERDILHQHARAYQYVTNGQTKGTGLCTNVFAASDSSFQVRGKLPKFSHPKLKALAARIAFDVDAPWLRNRSSVWPETWWNYLATIFRTNENALVFSKFNSKDGCALWPDADRNSQAPSSEDGAWYLCNPVDGQRRQVDRCRSESNPQGWTSRSQEAITSFRYLVLESDHKETDYPGVMQDWFKFLILLPLRIVTLYTSAGKSVHALVQIDATSKEDWDRQVLEMKPFLVEHGADPGALRAVQLTRLPYAYRHGRRQELLFCHPSADGTPIGDLPIIVRGGATI